MQTFLNAHAGDIVIAIADRIIENRAYLSEIDGKIGDGDHGVNMAKGFGMTSERLKTQDVSLAEAFSRIQDSKVRRRVLELVRTLASEADEGALAH